MKLEIRKNGDPVLRGKTKKIKESQIEELKDLIENMVETMRENNGVGLAAPQVGSDLRLCTVEVDDELFVLINPQITSKSKAKIISEEGCLSFPGQFFPIPRHSEVQVRYLDEHGKQRKVKGYGLLARAFQHEIDHLDGVLIIDRIKKNRKAIKKEETVIKKKTK